MENSVPEQKVKAVCPLMAIGKLLGESGVPETIVPEASHGNVCTALGGS
jgi:hypothetical protein